MELIWPTHIAGPLEKFERNILDRFESAGSYHHRLSEIAKTVMDESPEIYDLDSAEVLELAVTNGLPPQSWSNDFGEPALTGISNELFRLDFLYWAHNASPTHSHVSCGAFVPLRGRRRHRTYTYNKEVEADGVRFGKLTTQKDELLDVGQASEISPNLIHDLYWLKQPSVTLSLRCKKHEVIGSDAALRPWEFWENGLSVVDMVHRDSANTSRQLSSLRLMQKVAPSRFQTALESVALSSDQLLKYHLAVELSGTEWGMHYYDRYSELLRENENLLNSAISSLMPIARRKSLYNKLRSNDETTQFCIGLLWNGTDPADLERMLAENYDPSSISRALNVIDEIDMKL